MAFCYSNISLFSFFSRKIISDVFTTHLLINYPVPSGEHVLYISGLVNTLGLLGRPRIKLSWAKALPWG